MAAHRVFCLGSGYVALNLYRQLKGKIRRGQVDLTVVGSENFQCFHGLIPDVLAGRVQPSNVLTPARRFFQGCNFLNADIENIDLDNKTITVERSVDGRRLSFEYDELVIALGNTERLGHIVGLAEHSFRLKKYSTVLALRNQMVEALELANLETDPAAQRAFLTFVVAGGGFSGCEIVGLLREFGPHTIKRYYPSLNPDDFSAVLVSSTEFLLPDLKPRLPWASRYAEKVFRQDKHVDLRLGRKLKSIACDEVVLDDGSHIPTRTVVTCSGMQAVPVVQRLNVAKSFGDRIITDQYLNVQGYSGVWAGGDCASVPLEDGSTAPGLAIWAITQGAHIGKNICRSLDRKPLLKYRFNGLGDACTFGHHRAIAALNGLPFRVTGFPAYIVWSMFMIVYLPSFEKRMRVLFDWLLTLFTGNDILAAKSDSPMNITRVLFDASQVIINEGDTGNSMFFIQEGQVEVLKSGPDGSFERVASLGPGERFGEIAVFRNTPRNATVRALSHVKLIQVRREAAALLVDAGQEL